MSAKNAGAPAPTAHDAKRALIDDLEHSRHAGAPSVGGAETAPGEGWRKGELVAEVERLRDEVARARANDGMLAASLRQMEDRALAAIAHLPQKLRARCRFRLDLLLRGHDLAPHACAGIREVPAGMEGDVLV